jgi:cellulose synthase/poly-beta-1,6-N-acetylglucosamine synthase-like glycosyltransferase
LNLSLKKTEIRERIPKIAPTILPLPFEKGQPLWSVMIPVYNTFVYLEQCLLSVLEQDRGIEQMQIMVVDDASTDGNVEELVKRLGAGRIGYFRQPVNIGKLRNLETCVKLSEGKYIHLLYGDTVLLHDFYIEIESLFEDFPRIGAAFTDFEYINAKGIKIWDHQRLQVLRGVLKNWLLTIAKRQEVQPPAMVIKRSTYEYLGAYFGMEFGAFWEMSVRIAAHYEVGYCPRVLAKFRVHESNIALNSEDALLNIQEIAKVIGIIRGYLPFENRDKISQESKKYFAQYYARLSHKVYHEFNQPKVAIQQAWGALMMDINPISLKYSLLLFAKELIGYRHIRNLLGKI